MFKPAIVVSLKRKERKTDESQMKIACGSVILNPRGWVTRVSENATFGVYTCNLTLLLSE